MANGLLKHTHTYLSLPGGYYTLTHLFISLALVVLLMIFNDIENIPVSLLPKLYRIVHLLKKELVYPKSKSSNRSSLRGIWKGSEIDESLFDEARKSECLINCVNKT